MSLDLIVEVKQGKLQGKENASVLTGKPFYTFQGIPYAKPPVGELRFQAPVPLDKWEGVYDATYERSECSQIDFFRAIESVGDEDCLFLNISTPMIPNDIEIPKPVMVFFHGGAFQMGGGSEALFSADFLIERDVILVTFNYRLHILGFLNLGLPECTGNCGLKDQLLVLKWVKENIDKFGGDPDNITIFGTSAGSSSVHYQTISPLSKGLFNKAILQSGTTACSWALTSNSYEIGLKAGRLLGFDDGDDKEKLLQFLKQQKVEDLLKVNMEMKSETEKFNPAKSMPFSFGPSVEEIKEGAFLPELPEKLLKNVSVPIICGVCVHEGFICKSNLIQRIQEDFSIVLKQNFIIDPILLPDLVEKVQKHYFGDKPIDENCETEMCNLYTDLFFYRLYDTLEFTKYSSLPVFIYKFVHDGELNFFKSFGAKHLASNIKGAVHADELGYLFHAKVRSEVPKFTEEDLKTIENVTTMWTNFAKTGNPSYTVDWKSYDPEEPYYLRIEADLELVKGTVFGERMQFLRNLLYPVAKPFSDL